MKKQNFLLLFLFLFLPFSAKTEEKILNIYNWSNYIPEKILANFTKKTDIKINYDAYDSNEILEAKILAGNSGYDLIFPSERPSFERFAKINALKKFNKENIPNLKNLSPQLMNFIKPLDPQAEYGAIYQWGTIGIAINHAKVKALFPKEKINSLALLFDPKNAQKLSSCKISILNSQVHFLPMAYHYLNIDPNTSDLASIARVYKLLKAIRPYINHFNSSTYLDQLASGDICYAIGYSGDVLRMQHHSKHIKINYYFPIEGAQLGFDMMAIPKDAPHPKNAEAFINFVLDPQNMALISNDVFYANAVPQSIPYLNKAIYKNPNIYPPQELFDKMYVVDMPSAKIARLKNQLWMKFITGQ